MLSGEGREADHKGKAYDYSDIDIIVVATALLDATKGGSWRETVAAVGPDTETGDVSEGTWIVGIVMGRGLRRGRGDGGR